MDVSSELTDYSDTMSMPWSSPYFTQSIIWQPSIMIMLKPSGPFTPIGIAYLFWLIYKIEPKAFG